MEKLIKTMEENLARERKQLEERRQNFLVFTESELTTSCFEINAITELTLMLELKNSIKATEHNLTLLKYNTKYKGE